MICNLLNNSSLLLIRNPTSNIAKHPVIICRKKSPTFSLENSITTASLLVEKSKAHVDISVRLKANEGIKNERGLLSPITSSDGLYGRSAPTFRRYVDELKRTLPSPYTSSFLFKNPNSFGGRFR